MIGRARSTVFAGRHALVTGGSSGIGLAIACALARAGSQVHIAARRAAALDQARSVIEQARLDPSQQVTTHTCDVSSQSAVADLFAALRSTQHVPSVLVNSAGITVPGYFDRVPLKAYERVMQVNYFGTLYTIREALPAMIAARDGHILNVASVAGLLGVFGMAGYCASKFAVCGLSEALRLELESSGVVVSVLCPPDTDTPMHHEEEAIGPPEMTFISRVGGLVTADAVARAGLRGLARGRALIVPGANAKFVALSKRLAPGAVEGVGAALVRYARKRTRT